jgi:hypothetical protein
VVEQSERVNSLKRLIKCQADRSRVSTRNTTPRAVTRNQRFPVRSARTSRTSWSVCAAGTTCAEGELSAALP